MANDDTDANALCPATGMDDRVTRPIRVAALVEALMQATPRGAA
ncbi:MAG: hypothetical protein U5L05_11950 [Rubrivivax sp.]|nr:hypothetical protein [Rubrivivax sp.]